MKNWIDGLSELELQSLAPPLFVFDDDIETAASLMYREGIASPVASTEEDSTMIDRMRVELNSRPPKNYWIAVKSEIRLLVCTDDEKYRKLREQLSLEAKKGTAPAVAAISAVVGSVLGVEATLIAGFIALALYAVIKVGKEAYCVATDASET